MGEDVNPKKKVLEPRSGEKIFGPFRGLRGHAPRKILKDSVQDMLKSYFWTSVVTFTDSLKSSSYQISI